MSKLEFRIRKVTKEPKRDPKKEKLKEYLEEGKKKVFAKILTFYVIDLNVMGAWAKCKHEDNHYKTLRQAMDSCYSVGQGMGNPLTSIRIEV